MSSTSRAVHEPHRSRVRPPSRSRCGRLARRLGGTRGGARVCTGRGGRPWPLGRAGGRAQGPSQSQAQDRCLATRVSRVRDPHGDRPSRRDRRGSGRQPLVLRDSQRQCRAHHPERQDQAVPTSSQKQRNRNRRGSGRQPLVYRGQQHRTDHHERQDQRIPGPPDRSRLPAPVAGDNGQLSLPHHRGSGRQPLVHRVAGRQDRADHAERSHYPVSNSHGSQPSLRHRRRSRRQPLVHRAARGQDRADHPERHDHRVSDSDVGSFPQGITAGRDGNLWFTEAFASKIGRITPSGAITEFPTPTRRSSPSYGITMGREGNLWFTEEGANQIGRITMGGRIAEFPVPTPESQPTGITATPNGNLWFTELFANKIGVLNPKLLKCVVPNLHGKTLAQAEQLLSHAHCTLGRVPRSTGSSRKGREPEASCRQDPALWGHRQRAVRLTAAAVCCSRLRFIRSGPTADRHAKFR